MKKFGVVLASLILLLEAGSAYAMKKTAKEFKIFENPSVEKTLEFADYLLSDKDGEPTDEDIKQAARFFIDAALFGLGNPYEFIWNLTGNNQDKVDEILSLPLEESKVLFLQYYREFYKELQSK